MATDKLDGARIANTVLAALRCYQQQLGMNGDMPPKDVEDIATDEFKHESLTVDEIDELCQGFNFGEFRLVSMKDPSAEIAMTLLARRLKGKSPSRIAVAELADLVADALEVINPDKISAERKARSLASVLHEAAETLRNNRAH